jgi:proteic killer suppression protein
MWGNALPRAHFLWSFDLKGFRSLTITGNWRLIFRYDEETNTASDMDLIDYH